MKAGDTVYYTNPYDWITEECIVTDVLPGYFSGDDAVQLLGKTTRVITRIENAKYIKD